MRRLRQKCHQYRVGYACALWWMWVAVCAVAISPAWGELAGQALGAKSGYHLFNPTPTDLMRPMSADRPDGTESPNTVDAGHMQVELSFYEYSHDQDDGVQVDTWSIFNTNFKMGLTANSDLQIVFDAYTQEDTASSAGPDGRITGFGDVQLRLKMNLWGNDGGLTSFGVMPYVKIPTDTALSNGRIEGGLISMLAWNVGDDWSLGFMAEFDMVYDEVNDNYDLEFVHTVVLGVDLVGELGGYLEYIGVASSDSDSDYQVMLSTGLTYALSKNLVLDVGTRIGLTDSAEDVAIFTGVTWRY